MVFATLDNNTYGITNVYRKSIYKLRVFFIQYSEWFTFVPSPCLIYELIGNEDRNCQDLKAIN